MASMSPQDNRNYPENLNHNFRSGLHRLIYCALLTAVALTIFMIEAQIPLPIAIPGIKLGLSNIITVYAVFVLSPREGGMILFARVFLGAVFSGQMSTLLYSGGGGLLSILSLILLSKVLSKKEIWLASPIAALCHNFGQLCVAALVMQTTVVFAYLPYLAIAAVVSGLFTGLCVQYVVGRLPMSSS